MTKGTNNSIYKFKFINQKDRTDIHYFFTGNDVFKTLGFPRSSIYYSLKNKKGLLGQYKVERIYVPKRMVSY